MYQELIQTTRILKGHHGVVAALAGLVATLLLVLLLQAPADEQPASPSRLRWLRGRPATALWQATPARPAEGAAGHMTGRRRVAGFQRAHAERCPRAGAGVLLLAVVASAPAHRAARRAVRRTWAALATTDQFVFAFLLGDPPSDHRADLAAEDDLYGDLIIANFVDSYANLTLKSLAMLEWSDSYCPRAAFLLKTDDDVFINVPLLHEFALRRVDQRRSVWGHMRRGVRPIRNEWSKFFVPVVEFPKEYYPAYMDGPAYLMSGDCVRPLLRAAERTRFLRLEDVFVTGELAARGGLRRRAAPRWLLARRGRAPPARLVRRHVAVHPLPPRDLRRLRCSTPYTSSHTSLVYYSHDYLGTFNNNFK